jgi:hypothetical protein
MSELVCHCCGALLRPGDEPPFYVVRIERFADPSPPEFAGGLSAADCREEYESLIGQMRGMSAQELMDPVHRTLTLHLCAACHGKWIEDPTGSVARGG